MRNRTALALPLIAALSLVSCGGGGGGGGGAHFPITDLTPHLPLETQYILEAEITASDVKAPDGTYLDLYRVTPPEEVALYVEMRSSEIDSYLMLFTDDCVGKSNLNDWEPCFLEAQDGLGAGPEDAMIGNTLAPGQSYIIAANSFFVGEFGHYTLLTQMMPAAKKPVGFPAPP